MRAKPTILLVSSSKMLLFFLFVTLLFYCRNLTLALCVLISVVRRYGAFLDFLTLLVYFCNFFAMGLPASWLQSTSHCMGYTHYYYYFNIFFNVT